jgi:hypothetical protein
VVYGEPQSPEAFVVMQLTFDIPLRLISFDIFPTRLREEASSIRFLRFDLDGFLLTCRVPAEERRELLRFLRTHYREARLAAFRVTPEGRTMIRIRGSWDNPATRRGTGRWEGFAKLREIERRGDCYYVPPIVTGDALRVSVVGESSALRRLRNTFDSFGIEYTVHRLIPIEKEPTSPLGDLTEPQRRVLRLAHSLGYYDVPRRTTTDRIAKSLGMNKGTVGRHLRRAEKHLVDRLLP